MRSSDITTPPYREGPDSTATHDGKLYQLDTIFKLSALVPIKEFPIKELAWVLDYDTPNPERVEIADITAPIIVTPWEDKWVVIDGLHRLAKALELGLPTLPAKIIHRVILAIAEIKQPAT